MLLYIGLSGRVADAQPAGAATKPVFPATQAKNDDSRVESGSGSADPVRQPPRSAVLGAGEVVLPSLRGSRFSANGRRVAVWGAPADPAAGRSIDIWDTDSGRHRLRLTGHDHPIQAVLFARDGKRLVSAAFRESDAGGGVSCWDLATGQRVWRAPHGGVDLSQHPSGQRVRVLVGDQVRELRLDNGAEVGRFVAGPAVGLRLGARDRLSLGLNQKRDARIRLFDYSRQQELLRLRLESETPRSVVMSNDSRTVAAVAGDTVVMWEVVTGAELARLSGHQVRVLTLAFSQDGRFLASGSLDGTLRVWDVTTCALISSFAAHTRAVTCLDFAASGGHMVSGGMDRLVRIWHLEELLKSAIPAGDGRIVDLDSVWRDLASARPDQAYPAMARAAVSAPAIAYLLEKFKAELLVSGNQRARRLVEQLTDPDFAVRFRATQSLKRLLPTVRPFLLKSLDAADSDEMRYRLRRILRGTEGLRRFSDADVRRVRRVIQLLPTIPGPSAAQLLKLIAEHFPDAEIAGQARAAMLGSNRN